MNKENYLYREEFIDLLFEKIGLNESLKDKGLSKTLLDTLLLEIFNLIMDKVIENKVVQFIGFGKFYSIQRKGGKARNPKTGEEILTQDKIVPKFSASKPFKEKFLG